LILFHYYLVLFNVDLLLIILIGSDNQRKCDIEFKYLCQKSGLWNTFNPLKYKTG